MRSARAKRGTGVECVVYHLVCKYGNETIGVFILPRWMDNSLEEVIAVHDNHSEDEMIDAGVPIHDVDKTLESRAS